MRLPLISIGNSKGIRIPSSVLKQCQVDSEFELTIENDKIILTPIKDKAYPLNFSNIIHMSDQEIQMLLQSITMTTLCIALIGSNEHTKQRVFDNLSKSAFEIVEKEIQRLESLDAKELIIEMHRSTIDDQLNKMI